MSSTCLLCSEQNEIFVLPSCNHTNMCWKCGIKIANNSLFSCPICKMHNNPRLLFVRANCSKTYDEIQPIRSAKHSTHFYADHQIGVYIEKQLSHCCKRCGAEEPNLNALKRHYNEYHSRQFCQVCLDNKKCLAQEHVLYSESQLINHMSQGDMSPTGEITAYHPLCGICKIRFYDISQLVVHLKQNHFNCHICFVNCDKLKKVYYKNYIDLEKHFKKSHFICEKEECIEMKFENVFVSEQQLNKHFEKRHVKRKYDNKHSNNIYMFSIGQRKLSEDAFQFDGIGCNLQEQFLKVEKKIIINQKFQHKDGPIDIREFYPNVCKMYAYKTTKSIAQQIKRLEQKNSQLSLITVWLFKPLQMTNLSRTEIEKFFFDIFDRNAGHISHLFFSEKHKFFCEQEYFQQIQKKMKYRSIFAFYFAFPQLIRFLRDQNPTKTAMDEYYSKSLRQLRVQKFFIFHTLSSYSEVLILIKRYIEQTMTTKTILVEIYLKYLKQMSPSFYVENQTEMFYVCRDKMINIYHMVDRCRTKDLLKMSWLLKIGLQSNAYDHINEQFYFKTQDQCGKAFFSFNLQELSLIYAYILISLQAVRDYKGQFQINKNSRVQPFFLSQILKQINNKTKLNLSHIIEYEQMSLKEPNKRIKKARDVNLNFNDFPKIQKQYQNDEKYNVQQPLYELSLSKQSQDRLIKNKLPLNKDQRQFPSLIETHQIKDPIKVKAKVKKKEFFLNQLTNEDWNENETRNKLKTRNTKEYFFDYQNQNQKVILEDQEEFPKAKICQEQVNTVIKKKQKKNKKKHNYQIKEQQQDLVFIKCQFAQGEQIINKKNRKDEDNYKQFKVPKKNIQKSPVPIIKQSNSLLQQIKQIQRIENQQKQRKKEPILKSFIDISSDQEIPKQRPIKKKLIEEQFEALVKLDTQEVNNNQIEKDKGTKIQIRKSKNGKKRFVQSKMLSGSFNYQL